MKTTITSMLTVAILASAVQPAFADYYYATPSNLNKLPEINRAYGSTEWQCNFGGFEDFVMWPMKGSIQSLQLADISPGETFEYFGQTHIIQEADSDGYTPTIKTKSFNGGIIESTFTFYQANQSGLATIESHNLSTGEISGELIDCDNIVIKELHEDVFAFNDNLKFPIKGQQLNDDGFIVLVTMDGTHLTQHKDGSWDFGKYEGIRGTKWDFDPTVRFSDDYEGYKSYLKSMGYRDAGPYGWVKK